MPGPVNYATTPAPANPNPPTTFKGSLNSTPDLPVQPVRTNPTAPVPQLNAPGNHTADVSVKQAAYYLISNSNAAPAPKPATDADGWHALEQ